MNKKRLCIVLIVVFIVIVGVVLSIVFLPKVNMSFANEGKAIFKYESKDISDNISSDDFAEICRLFDGKKLYSDNPSCGFSDDVSIMINGTESFCFAKDTCPVVLWKNKNKYFNLSDDEYVKLTEILGKYGFVFPCL